VLTLLRARINFLSIKRTHAWRPVPSWNSHSNSHFTTQRNRTSLFRVLSPAARSQNERDSVIEIISASPLLVPRKLFADVRGKYQGIVYSCYTDAYSRPSRSISAVRLNVSFTSRRLRRWCLGARYTYIRVRFKMPLSNAEYRRRQAPPWSVNSFAGRAPVCPEVADDSRKGLWSINATTSHAAYRRRPRLAP